MKMSVYQVMYNNAAGDYYVNQWTEKEWQADTIRNQEGHFSEVAICRSEAELEALIQEIRGPVVYAVFENRAAGEVFISEEDNLSGNWRGSKYGHFSLIGTHNTREEAEVQAQSSREYYAHQVKYY
jgi:hypothetical protein